MSRLLLVIGVAAVFGAALLILGGRPPADVGEALAAPNPTPTPTPPSPASTARPTPGAIPTAPATTPPPRVATQSARVADAAPAAAVPPTRLSAPAATIDADVVPVGVTPDGAMEVPEDVDELGWYRHGPGLGDSTGSIVLAGHVDSRTQGRGAFFALRDLAPGDELRLAAADGTTGIWVVTGRSTIDKEEIPLEELFRRDGPPRLVLVTCGGDFDADRRSYRSNVVVTAEPRP